MRSYTQSICLTLLLLVHCVSLCAQQRSYNEAMTIASEKAKVMNLSLEDETSNSAKAKKNIKQQEESNASPYYVFNFTDNNGFVIVGGDGQLPSIVGYSDKGHFNKDSIPTQLGDFLDAYTNTIEAVKNGEEKAVKNVNAAMKRTNGSFNAVAPLLGGIEWNQGEPFNNLCPLYDGENRAVTGCVATAMAQIMRYWKWPKTLKKGIPAINRDNYSVDSIPPSYQYQWDSMLESYNGNYTDAQATAVASLMLHAGASIRMWYGGMSTGFSDDVAPAMIKYFDYDSTCVQYLKREYFEWEDWNNILQKELNAGRPMYYSGFAAGYGIGHAFVCDGLDSDGLYHINWGWGGMSDGYFDITILNPSSRGYGAVETDEGYNNDNEIVIGIVPNDGQNHESSFEYDHCLLEAGYVDFKQLNREDSTKTFQGSINYQFTSPFNQDKTVTLSLAIKDDSGDYTCIGSQRTVTFPRKDSWENITLPFDYVFSKGITKVYAIESTDSGATWNECYGNRSNALEVFVTDTLLKASSNRYTEYDDSQGLHYNIDNWYISALVSSGRNCSGDIIIPEQVTIDGQTCYVTEIENECFSGSSIKSIVIPKTITELQRHIFLNCDSLVSVTFAKGSTLRQVGKSCFQGCKHLKSVSFPSLFDGKIPDFCFAYCDSIEKIEVPNGITSLGNSAFNSCFKLDSIKISDSFEGDIPEYSFGWCFNLKEVNIPEGVTGIGSSAFYSCRGLRKITMPQTMSGEIGIQAFAMCPNLEGTLVIPEGVSSIAWQAFYSCGKVSKIEFPSTLRTIGSECFIGCEELKEVISRPEVMPQGMVGAFAPSADMTSMNTTLYVHQSSLDEYKDSVGDYFLKVLPLEDSTNGIKAITDDGIKIYSSGNTVMVTGLKNNTEVRFYSIDGMLLAKKKAQGSNVCQPFHSPIVIVRVGGKASKVLLCR